MKWKIKFMFETTNQLWYSSLSIKRWSLRPWEVVNLRCGRFTGTVRLDMHPFTVGGELKPYGITFWILSLGNLVNMVESAALWSPIVRNSYRIFHRFLSRVHPWFDGQWCSMKWCESFICFVQIYGLFNYPAGWICNSLMEASRAIGIDYSSHWSQLTAYDGDEFMVHSYRITTFPRFSLTGMQILVQVVVTAYQSRHRALRSDHLSGGHAEVHDVSCSP